MVKANQLYTKVTPTYIIILHLHHFHITASLFITENVHCAWLALERFTERLEKTIERIPAH